MILSILGLIIRPEPAFGWLLTERCSRLVGFRFKNTNCICKMPMIPWYNIIPSPVKLPFIIAQKGIYKSYPVIKWFENDPRKRKNILNTIIDTYRNHRIDPVQQHIILLRVIPTMAFQGIYYHIYSDLYYHIYSDILSAILSGIYLAFYLAFSPASILTF